MKEKKTAKKNATPLDTKCIWMQAGVISYKLCSLDFRCENCELDKALRGQYSHMVKEESDLMFPNVESFTFEEIIGDVSLFNRYDYALIRIMYNCFSSICYSPDVHYSPSHLWLYQTEGDITRIGLDDFAGKCLDPIENIVFPIAGNYIQKGATICWLFLEDWNFRLSSPLAGQVKAVNRTTLQQNPNFLQKDNYRTGWLLEIKSDQATLLHPFFESTDSIKQWYRKCLLDIFHDISVLLDQEGEKAGVTMSDGGTMVNRLRQVMGRDKYIKLMKKILRHNWSRVRH